MKKSHFFSVLAGLVLLGSGDLFAGNPKEKSRHLNTINVGGTSILRGYDSGWNHDELFGCYSDDYDDSFCFGYNRVDGLFLGFKKPRELYRRHGIFQFYGMAGIGLENNRFQYQFALERSFFPAYRQFAIGAEIYDLTFSEDEWIIPSLENSLSSLLIHEDYQDYYRREGRGGFFSQQFTRKARLKVGYYEEDHINLVRETDWALFGGRKSFRFNPTVEELTLRGILGQFRIDTRNRWRNARKGWLVNLVAEYFPEEFEGQSDFKRYIIDIRRFQPISRGENLNIRIRVGESEGILPVQKYFDLGGISTLRAYDYKSLSGDRMVLGNLEYVINWDRLYWDPGIPIIDEFNLILFADAGLAWFKDYKEFDELTANDLYSDVGVGFSNDDGTVRLNIAKRLDRATDAVKVTFRISRPF